MRKRRGTTPVVSPVYTGLLLASAGMVYVVLGLWAMRLLPNHEETGKVMEHNWNGGLLSKRDPEEYCFSGVQMPLTIFIAVGGMLAVYGLGVASTTRRQMKESGAEITGTSTIALALAWICITGLAAWSWFLKEDVDETQHMRHGSSKDDEESECELQKTFAWALFGTSIAASLAIASGAVFVKMKKRAAAAGG